MKNKPAVVFCAMCFFLGTVAPWGFVVLGAIISVVTQNVEHSTTAAYLTAFGLLLLAGSFLMKRLANSLSRLAS